MNFEEALTEELSSIEQINGKVYPLKATEGDKPPFVIYISSEGLEAQTLEGFHDSKELTCEIHVITQHYHQLKDLTRLVINKLQTFYGRQIGTDGPLVRSLSFDEPREVHEDEVDYSRSSFEIRVRI